MRAEEAVRRAFDAELRDGQIQHVEIGLGMSILAVVGDGMAGAHGVAAKVFNSLGDAAISVRAIAQGASERNISVVVDGKVAAKALRAVHAAFYLSPNTLSIGLIGPGTVGRVLLAQIATQIERLRALNLDLRVRGIASSKRMLLEETAVDLDHWAERFAEAGEPLDLEKFANHVQADYIPHTVIVDCTASAEVADHYRRLAEARHSRRDAEQEGQQRLAALLPLSAGGGAGRRHALSVRGHGGRGTAHHPDAARSARDRR